MHLRTVTAAVSWKGADKLFILVFLIVLCIYKQAENHIFDIWWKNTVSTVHPAEKWVVSCGHFGSIFLGLALKWITAPSFRRLTGKGWSEGKGNVFRSCTSKESLPLIRGLSRYNIMWRWVSGSFARQRQTVSQLKTLAVFNSLWNCRLMDVRSHVPASVRAMCAAVRAWLTSLLMQQRSFWGQNVFVCLCALKADSVSFRFSHFRRGS